MTYLLASALVVGGVAVGFIAFWLVGQRNRGLARQEAERILSEAKAKQKELILEARDEALRQRAAAESEYRERRTELQRLERRVSQKEENLERRLEALEKRDRSLAARDKDLEGRHQEVAAILNKQRAELEAIGGLTSGEAKELLLQRVEEEVKEDAARRAREWEARILEEAATRARKVLAEAVQRYAADVVTETTVSVVPLPSDDMKGRLIGREGRNIRALEQATGVDLIIDDTPEVVTLSSFDPVRREVARQALSKLILDGRIHPARIEEIVEKARADVDQTIIKAGEEAAIYIGLPGLHPELIKLLGRLKYRTSYGQNVLNHSIEVASVASVIATELGANVNMAKKSGLLHDIGKAIDHEVEGTHALLGAQLVEQWDKSPVVAQAIAQHHGESDITTVEGFIVAAADAVSGARPGARGEMVEHYLKRLQALENLANSFSGVEKAYAIQAGREVRIMVKPDQVDDLVALRLARDIVKKIEDTLEYPGQIRVTVIRETRAVEFAK
ncbi:MAG: ribonuclease Y [Dehalococcoidia bacterium]|nr:ribonuclease Y [Dehalococcoidia bacterium]